MGIVDHVNIPVADYRRAKRFYDAVMASLGCALFAEDGPAAGYGKGDWNFGIVETEGAFAKLHLAFEAASRSQVAAFYKAAMSAGAADNGPPGLRSHYDANYYAAFVIDLDGHNIEAVFRG